MTRGKDDGASVGNVEYTDQDGVLIAVVTGEIDITNVDAVRADVEALLNKHPAGLVVDLEVSFLGSVGLSALVHLHNRAQDKGVAFVVVAPAYPSQRPIAATGLDQVVQVAEKVPDAVTSIKATWAASDAHEQTS